MIRNDKGIYDIVFVDNNGVKRYGTIETENNKNIFDTINSFYSREGGKWKLLSVKLKNRSVWIDFKTKIKKLSSSFLNNMLLVMGIQSKIMKYFNIDKGRDGVSLLISAIPLFRNNFINYMNITEGCIRVIRDDMRDKPDKYKPIISSLEQNSSKIINCIMDFMTYTKLVYVTNEKEFNKVKNEIESIFKDYCTDNSLMERSVKNFNEHLDKFVK